MTEIKIEIGIPIPPVEGVKKGHRKLRYPWKDMEVGDSFAVPASSKLAARTTGTRLLNVARNAVSPFQIGRDYTTRSFDDHVRIWRIK